MKKLRKDIGDELALKGGQRESLRSSTDSSNRCPLLSAEEYEAVRYLAKLLVEIFLEDKQQ